MEENKHIITSLLHNFQQQRRSNLLLLVLSPSISPAVTAVTAKALLFLSQPKRCSMGLLAFTGRLLLASVFLMSGECHGNPPPRCCCCCGPVTSLQDSTEMTAALWGFPGCYQCYSVHNTPPDALHNRGSPTPPASTAAWLLCAQTPGGMKMVMHEQGPANPILQYMTPKMDGALDTVYSYTGVRLPIEREQYATIVFAAGGLELLGGLLFTLNARLGAVLLVSGALGLGGSIPWVGGLSQLRHTGFGWQRASTALWRQNQLMDCAFEPNACSSWVCCSVSAASFCTTLGDRLLGVCMSVWYSTRHCRWGCWCPRR